MTYPSLQITRHTLSWSEPEVQRIFPSLTLSGGHFRDESTNTSIIFHSDIMWLGTYLGKDPLLNYSSPSQYKLSSPRCNYQCCSNSSRASPGRNFRKCSVINKHNIEEDRDSLCAHHSRVVVAGMHLFASFADQEVSTKGNDSNLRLTYTLNISMLIKYWFKHISFFLNTPVQIRMKSATSEYLFLNFLQSKWLQFD